MEYLFDLLLHASQHSFLASLITVSTKSKVKAPLGYSSSVLRFSQYKLQGTPSAKPLMSLPPGYSPPANKITPDDHGGWVVIASGVGMMLAILFILIRLAIRFPFHKAFSTMIQQLLQALYVLKAATRTRVYQFSSFKRCRSPAPSKPY